MIFIEAHLTPAQADGLTPEDTRRDIFKNGVLQSVGQKPLAT